MDRNTAEKELTHRSDGTFLVRESVNREGEYALSVRQVLNYCMYVQTETPQELNLVAFKISRYKQELLKSKVGSGPGSEL